MTDLVASIKREWIQYVAPILGLIAFVSLCFSLYYNLDARDIQHTMLINQLQTKVAAIDTNIGHDNADQRALSSLTTQLSYDVKSIQRVLEIQSTKMDKLEGMRVQALEVALRMATQLNELKETIEDSGPVMAKQP